MVDGDSPEGPFADTNNHAHISTLSRLRAALELA